MPGSTRNWDRTRYEPAPPRAKPDPTPVHPDPPRNILARPIELPAMEPIRDVDRIAQGYEDDA